MPLILSIFAPSSHVIVIVIVIVIVMVMVMVMVQILSMSIVGEEFVNTVL